MLKSLMSNPYAWAVLAIATLFSALYGVYCRQKGKKRKQVSFACSSYSLVNSGICRLKNVQVSYSGRTISDLSFSHIYIWNSGNEVINASDIASTMPLSIHNTGSAEILEAGIIRTNEPANCFSLCECSADKIEIGFEYLAPGEGVAIQVVHSGLSRDLEVLCKIKGGDDVCDVSKSGRSPEKARRQHRAETFIQVLPSFVMLGFTMLAVWIASLIRKANGLPSQSGNIWFNSILIVGAWILGAVLSAIIVKRIRKNYGGAIPKGLLDATAKDKAKSAKHEA